MEERWTGSNASLARRKFKNGSDNENVLNALVQRSRRQTKSRYSLADVARFYLQRVRLFAKKILNTSDLSTQKERFLFSVLAMLIAFVTFWTSSIFAILNGSNLILRLSIVALLKCGRSARRAWRSIRAS